MDPIKEMAAKLSHDPHLQSPSVRQVFLPGPLIVGAGPSGLAVAACLKERGIPRVILERAHCLGSLWKFRTYDRLRLHLPKQFCELPYLPFPDHYPTYPSKEQFSTYLDSYAQHFNLQPVFERAVVKAEYDNRLKLWRVWATGPKKEMIEYVCKWLIVATGENAEAYEPEFEGRDNFVGPIIHSTEYKSGHEFNGKKVLVVGCGNSGMELCLDLCNHNAYPSMVVRDSVHILPQEILGVSTFGMSMWLLKWFPLKVVDQILLLISRLMLGDTSQLGIDRPTIGPLQYKYISGKTPVLDVGTLAKVKAGNIKVFPGIKRFTRQGVEFVDGRTENFDVIILATGYKSNVPSWLQDSTMFSKNDGYPVKQFPNGWKGEKGLYAVGFTKRGLLGITHDAIKIAQDIERDWITQAKHLISTKINRLHNQTNGIEDNYF